MRGRIRTAAAVLAFVAPAIAWADDDQPPKPADPFYTLDTKNLFGFLEGADVGEAGDRSVEFETTGAFDKGAGRYGVIEQEFIYETAVTDRFGLEYGAHFVGQSLAGAPGLDDYSGVDFSGFSNEWRYVIVQRTTASPTQITVTVEPEWTRIEDGGRHVIEGALPLLAIVDTQPIPNRLYAALNVAYRPEEARAPGEGWAGSSMLTSAAAISLRLTPPLMIGVEADYDRAYDGLALQGLQGQAAFLGPIFHLQITDKLDLSGGWLTQVAGRTRGDDRPFDLVDFSREQGKLRLEVEF